MINHMCLFQLQFKELEDKLRYVYWNKVDWDGSLYIKLMYLFEDFIYTAFSQMYYDKLDLRTQITNFLKRDILVSV